MVCWLRQEIEGRKPVLVPAQLWAEASAAPDLCFQLEYLLQGTGFYSMLCSRSQHFFFLTNPSHSVFKYVLCVFILSNVKSEVKFTESNAFVLGFIKVNRKKVSSIFIIKCGFLQYVFYSLEYNLF